MAISKQNPYMFSWPGIGDTFKGDLVKELPGSGAHKIPPPTLPNIELPSSNPDLETPRFLKIRQFLTRHALKDIEIEHIEDQRHHNVLRAVASGSQIRRGFKLLPKPENTPEHLTPLTLREKITSSHRQRQDRKLRIKAHEGHERMKLYESKPDWKKFIDEDEFSKLTTSEKNWAILVARRKAATAPASSTYDEVRGSMATHTTEDGRIINVPLKRTRAETKMHIKNKSIHDRNHKTVKKIKEKLDTAAEGETFFGKRRKAKIEKGRAEIVRLQKRSDLLDRIEYKDKIEAEKARVEKSQDKRKNAESELTSHDSKEIPNGTIKRKIHYIKRGIIQKNVNRSKKNSIEKVPKFKGSTELEEPGIRKIQHEFGEKWADDLELQLLRTEEGRNKYLEFYTNLLHKIESMPTTKENMKKHKELIEKIHMINELNLIK